ncbi:MAG: DUF1905 domain-containing protein [Blastocatellia bacterium]|nr:DUF1905 domain-containing protein [Blastocatellia bacterium]
MRSAKFKAKLEKFSPESGWHYITVSAAAAGKFRFEEGSRRVVCRLEGRETLQCALMPYHDAFFIMVNKGIRTRLGIEPGDTLSVEIWKDESKYGLPMPEEFREILDQDPEGDELFHGLTPGKQRSILYILGKPKDLDRRIQMGLIVIEHLKDNEGKIDHSTLAQDLKRPVL